MSRARNLAASLVEHLACGRSTASVPHARRCEASSLTSLFTALRRLHEHEAAESLMRDLRPQLELDLPDATRVVEAATIKADHAMAYADAFAAATALAHRATLLTGDPEPLLPSAPWDQEDLRSS